ncbi:hypothetical protein SARC_11181, partial [Sphaeroforma arctica JP610]
MASTERTRELVFNEDTVDVAMARLEAFDCDTLLAVHSRLQTLVAERTAHELKQSGAREPICLNGTKIPPEIMFNILEWCRLVCRSFYSIVTDVRTWTTIPEVAYKTGGRLDEAIVGLPETLEVFCRYPNLRTWTISTTLNFISVSSADIDAIAMATPELKNIEGIWFTFWRVCQKMDLASLTRLTVTSDDGLKSIDSPLIQSASLQYLDYWMGSIEGTVNELL